MILSFFIWLHWVLAAACSIFCCGIWDLVPYQGSNYSVLLHWECRGLATRPPGKSLPQWFLSMYPDFWTAFDKVFPKDQNQNLASATMSWETWRKFHRWLDLNFYSIKKDVEPDSVEMWASANREPDRRHNHLNSREVLQEGPHGSPMGHLAQGQSGRRHSLENC